MTDEGSEPRVEFVPLPSPRPLSKEERALVNFLLDGPLGGDELHAQAETARVVAICSCGCRSVQLEVDQTAPSPVFAKEVPFRVDWIPITANQIDGETATEVTLHVCAGRLLELEIWTGAFGARPEIDIGRLEYLDWSALTELD